MPSREERIALNEAAFRVANERMRDWKERHEHGAGELYFCECADPDCREKVTLLEEEYEDVRANSRYFLICSGHEIPDVETVIADHGRYAVVEKNPEVTDIAEATDPRNDG